MARFYINWKETLQGSTPVLLGAAGVVLALSVIELASPPSTVAPIEAYKPTAREAARTPCGGPIFNPSIIDTEAF